MKKLVIITNIPSPYRVDFFYYLQENIRDYEIHILYASRNEDNRAWEIDESKMRNSHFLDSWTLKIPRRYDTKYIHISKGEIYGFLGPNGAGKTTVMKMITNLWKPTSGTIEVFGEVLTPKSYEVLKRMGSIIEFPTFYDHMTGRENLQLHCEYMGYYNVDSVESALQTLDLTAAADQPVKSYSLGMKERLGIARAIMCKPELLILDEPTNGLDPAGMKQIRDLLRTLCSEYGITVMISSHILSEVESIADTVGIIHHGKMMKEIRMQDIEEMNLNYVELSVTDEKRAAYVLTDKLGLHNFKILESGKIRIYDHEASTQQLTKTLALNDVEVVSIGKKSKTLEDYFLKLTGEVKDHA